MIGGHFFRYFQDECPRDAGDLPCDDAGLRLLLSREVVERFVRLIPGGLTPVPLCLSSPEESEEPPLNPGHPACAEYASTDYCRESWQLHLAELQSRQETHWHKCDYGKYCAFVAVVFRDQCLAAVKLAGAGPTMTEAEFEHQVEILDALVKAFVVSEAAFFERLLDARPTAAADQAPQPQSTQGTGLENPRHPQVMRAIEYIEEHLVDPGLTVGRVARALDIHPNYLSHLFALQVGQRMGRFILTRRVEMAKELLLTTDWQIKRVARETGHANPNWFCYIFGAQAGVTPSEYRRRAHKR